MASAQEAQKPDKKEEKRLAKIEELRKKNEPATVVIRSTLDAIKAELIRSYLAEGCRLAKEEPSQLIFSRPFEERKNSIGRAVLGSNANLRIDYRFTLVAHTEAVTVFAVMDIISKNREGIDEYPLARFGPSREAKAEMQKCLDKLKEKIESPEEQKK